MAGEFYDDIESGEKTVETRELSAYNLKRTIGLKTIRLQRGYGHPGKPPKKMRYEVVKPHWRTNTATNATRLKCQMISSPSSSTSILASESTNQQVKQATRRKRKWK